MQLAEIEPQSTFKFLHEPKYVYRKMEDVCDAIGNVTGCKVVEIVAILSNGRYRICANRRIEDANAYSEVKVCEVKVSVI